MLSLLAAYDENRVIGVDGNLPWDLPDDLRRFRALTMGRPIIMGRKTFESIGRPLPGRRNIVMSQQPDYAAAGCVIVGSLDEALSEARDAAETFIIGGGQVFAQTLALADRLDLTLMRARVPRGDTYFPDVDFSEWREVAREHHPADARHAYAFDFVTFERATSY